jgi:hypothetical protein
MITYGIPTYTQYQRALDQLEHILLCSTVKPSEIIIVDNSGGLNTPFIQERVDQLSKEYTFRNQVIPNENCVAGAWNKIMQNAWYANAVVIANDDIKPDAEMLQHFQSDRFYPFVCGNSQHNAFSVFMLRRDIWEKVGPFDEEFKPAYFEDNDYARRMELAGIPRYVDSRIQFDHVVSATFKQLSGAALDAHHINFRKNRDYYIRKWGGLPGKETYLKPFGG